MSNIQKVREALEPFASDACYLKPERITSEDWRRARAALALLDDLAKVEEWALEAAAKALIDHDPAISGHHPIHVDYKRPIARAAITAYLAALTEAKR